MKQHFLNGWQEEIQKINASAIRNVGHNTFQANISKYFSRLGFEVFPILLSVTLKLNSQARHDTPQDCRSHERSTLQHSPSDKLVRLGSKLAAVAKRVADNGRTQLVAGEIINHPCNKLLSLGTRSAKYSVLAHKVAALIWLTQFLYTEIRISLLKGTLKH
jgi:hypothetical protein